MQLRRSKDRDHLYDELYNILTVRLSFFDAIRQKRVLHHASKHRETVESRTPKAECSYRFEVFGPVMKHEVLIFDMSSVIE